MAELLVHDAAELVVGPATTTADSDHSAGGNLETYEDGALAVADGTVVAAGRTDVVCEEHPPETAERVIDAAGKTVVPGFVDSHTHALFAGDRSDEFVARSEGKSYTEIMDAGGGIAVSVEAVREATDAQLRANLSRELDVMLAHGTTTAEVKSGYGLDTETERRMLDAIRSVDETHPVDLVATFMGAHAVPAGRNTDEYVEAVIEEQLPAVAEQGVAQFCDVFCEAGVFEVEQSRRILTAAQEAGLQVKLHAEEFERIGGAQLAADLGAVSADHLLAANEEDADALREAGVVATFMPATALALDEPYADPTAFLDGPVALGTDLNPSCFVHSMPTVTALAVMGMGLHPSRAIRAATRGGARALGVSDTVAGTNSARGSGSEPAAETRTAQGRRLDSGCGTLQEGTTADFTVFDLPSHVHIPYNAGTNRVETVIKGGSIVHESGTVGGVASPEGTDE